MRKITGIFCTILILLSCFYYANDEVKGQEPETSCTIDMNMKPAQLLPIDELAYGNPTNPYKTLKTPAQITKQGDYYFIVDCYHNQILYSTQLEKPIEKWKVMTSDVELPHSLASDGQVYLVADTENNRVLVFERKYGRFQNTQCLEQIGVRTHYIQYDSATDSFFAWSSMTGDMYILKKDPTNGRICIQEIRHIYELENFYVRSFYIAGEHILFPSGNNAYIILADKKTLQVKERYPVTEEIAGMAYIIPIDNYFYMTISTDLQFDHSAATMIRTKDLTSLARGEYEKIYANFQTKGIPYYIDRINGRFYMTNHGSSKSIISFSIENDTIHHIATLF